jgi:hypothetical protein
MNIHRLNISHEIRADSRQDLSQAPKLTRTVRNIKRKPQSMPPQPKSHLFCFGLSYTARALISHLMEAAIDVPLKITATVRTEDAPFKLSIPNLRLVRFGSEESFQALTVSDWVLSSVPPSQDRDPVVEVYGASFKEAHPKWVGYLSTTGPYGDCGGAWVDESAPVKPAGPRGKRRAEAEAEWSKLADKLNLPLHIFRLPGLYGPGRSMFDRLRDGTARRIIKKGQVFSRIHIDDMAAILAASMTNPHPRTVGAPPALYNVADDLPAPPQDIVTYAAELLNKEPPPEIPFETANLSPMARSFYGDNKRISNALMKSELGITLKYPTYREGLRAILAAEQKSN